MKSRLVALAVGLSMIAFFASTHAAPFECGFPCLERSYCEERELVIVEAPTECPQGSQGDACCFADSQCTDGQDYGTRQCTDACRDGATEVQGDDLCPGPLRCCAVPQTESSEQAQGNANTEEQEEDVQSNHLQKLKKTLATGVNVLRKLGKSFKQAVLGPSSADANSAKNGKDDDANENSANKDSKYEPVQAEVDEGSQEASCSDEMRQKLMEIAAEDIGNHGLKTEPIARYLAAAFFGGGKHLKRAARSCQTVDDCYTDEHHNSTGSMQVQGQEVCNRYPEYWSCWMAWGDYAGKMTCLQPEGRCQLWGVDYCASYVAYSLQEWMRRYNAQIPEPVTMYADEGGKKFEPTRFVINVSGFYRWMNWRKELGDAVTVLDFNQPGKAAVTCADVKVGDILIVGSGTSGRSMRQHITLVESCTTMEDGQARLNTIDGNARDAAGNSGAVTRTYYTNTPTKGKKKIVRSIMRFDSC